MNLKPSFLKSNVETDSRIEETVSSKNPPVQCQDYLESISKISTRLFLASNEDLDFEITYALKDLLLALDIDRTGFIEVTEGTPFARVIYIGYAEGIETVSSELNLVEIYPYGYQQICIEGKISNLGRVEDLPSEGKIDLQSYLQMGIKSSLIIPLSIDQRVRYLFVVERHRVALDWPDNLIPNLRMLGEIFVTALQRRETEQLLWATNERLDLASDSAGAGLWEINLDDGKIWLTDKARELLFLAPEIDISLKDFMANVHADDHEKINAAIEDARITGDIVSIDYRAVDPEGTIRWMRSIGRLQPRGRSGRSRIMGVTVDVTEHKLKDNRIQDQILEIERLRQQLEMENDYLRNEIKISKDVRISLGASLGMQAVMEQVSQVAATSSTVLILGETGTGKELVAETLHRLSDRGHRIMVKVNCGALPAALVESELFGRDKGAYTGALTKQAGRFELADGSTLFLDEIAEMPLETQSKLLRVLQEGEFERLGSSRTLKVNVRIIAATNRDLAKEVELGRFRRDLFYRLNIFPIHVPPLRERTEDILALVWEFVNEFSGKMGKRIRRIDKNDLEKLKFYQWPGNVRELRNVIEHAMIISNNEILNLKHFTHIDIAAPEFMSLENMERHHIQTILGMTCGRIKGRGGAAELLDLKPSTLYSRMKKLNIKSLPQ